MPLRIVGKTIGERSPHVDPEFPAMFLLHDRPL